MRILFAGTDEIAVPTLEALDRHRLVCAVLTTPDAPGKRGRALLPSPVKVKAMELGIPVIQPDHLGSKAREVVSRLAPDTLLSFCYGRIFGPKFLALFQHRFNIHPSLLPKYRGCSPIQNTILNLDRKGGISIQDIAEAVDEGDIYITQSFDLDGTETTEGLSARVSVMAADLAVRLLSSLDVFRSRPQPDVGASYTALVRKEDALLDFHRDAMSLHAAVRAYSAWPKATCMLDGQPIYLLGVWGSAFDIPHEECAEEPGTVAGYVKGRGVKIATGDGYLYVDSLQLPTKKAMDSASFINGRRDIIGKVLM